MQHGQPSSADAFAAEDRVVQSWYPAVRSRDLPRGAAASLRLRERELVAWRAADGTAHVFDSRCPHLGADLAQGDVVGDTLRCPLHHWRFGAGGRCVAAPACAARPHRTVRAFPVEERWGLVWFFAGREPLFELPGEREPGAHRRHVLGRRESRASAHLLTGSQLDQSHFPALHAFDPVGPPRIAIGSFRLTVQVRYRPRQRWVRLVTGTRTKPLEACFRTYGCNTCLIEVTSPVRFQVLFSGRPEGSRTHIHPVLRLPRGSGVDGLRALFLVARLTAQDDRILERMRFAPGFVDSDRPLRDFYEQVIATPLFQESDRAPLPAERGLPALRASGD